MSAIAERVSELHEDVRRAQADGDYEGARNTLRAIQTLDPGNALAESLLDGSARHCQMTLMFCDLVGSTGLAERLDPEDMSDVLRIYRTACAEVVERYEGFLEDRRGDGLLMRFGPPTVHEDDPYRAVRTGLGIVEAIRDRARAVKRDLGVELAARIAVHTGMVLIDAGDVVGTTPNEAARLQALAEPNEVLISGATWELVSRQFDVEPRGPARLRGVSREIETYAVRKERPSSPLEPSRWLTSSPAGDPSARPSRGCGSGPWPASHHKPSWSAARQASGSRGSSPNPRGIWVLTARCVSARATTRRRACTRSDRCWRGCAASRTMTPPAPASTSCTPPPAGWWATCRCSQRRYRSPPS